MAFTPRRLMRGASGAGGQYQISRSLRFNSADSANLTRTPSSASNQKTWTWSGWVKRSALGTNQTIFNAGGNGFVARFNSSTDYLEVYNYSGAYQLQVLTAQVFRDVSAWYHLVISIDTTQATDTNRFKLYVNGSQVTSFYGAPTYPSQNTDLLVNGTGVHALGVLNSVGQYFDGYMTEINFVNAQQLTPSSFGETNADTGVWQPKRYSGSYGTNGFYLNFSDNSNTTAATLGKDYSGNGNNFTPNNFSVTAGAGNDSLVDSPTSYGTDTGVGGSVRGNYCTFSAVDKATTVTLSNGSLDLIGTNGGGRARASMAVSSGKWYFEFLMVAVDGGGYNGFMATTAPASVTGGGATTDLGNSVDTWGIPNFAGGTARNNNTNGAGITGITNGQIGMFALDMDSGKFWYGINGTWVNTGDPATGANPVYSNLSGYTVAAAIGHGVGTYISYTYNFGQRAFAYTAPTGYKAMTTQNLPTPTIGATTATQSGKFFNAVLYTGTGSDNRAVTGVGFQPDFVWVKGRDIGQSHVLNNAVAGVGTAKTLYSNLTVSQGTYDDYGYLQSLDSDGYTIKNGSINGNLVNASGYQYVAWNWKAGGTGVNNTAGSITSSVSASPTSGFSIVTYTGTGANATVGHGIGIAPSMIIIKNRSTSSYDWMVYHTSIGATKYLRLNQTDAAAISSSAFNDTSPTSTVFNLGNGSLGNQSTYTYVAYCFAPVAGYSAFGTYTGNGSATDGPFVFTGFRPAFIFIKSSSRVEDWHIMDTSRSTYNKIDADLYPNLSNAEAANNGTDILSNGFKLRSTDSGTNFSAATYIYMAFASNPFKYSLAR